MYGISADAAIEQLRLQHLLDEIPFQALDADLVEVYTTPGQEFHVDYLKTGKDDVPGQVFAALEERGLAQYLRVSVVDVSDSELRKAQKVASLAAGGNVASWIDPASGQIVMDSVELLDRQTRDDVRAAVAEIAPRVRVAWRKVANLPLPAVGGGRGLTNNGCTAGFVVRHTPSNDLGLSSAAHCSNSATYLGNSLTLAAEKYADSQDVQWWRGASVNWDKTFWDGGAYRPVTARRAYSNININDWVCKTGQATGVRCGQVTSRTYCPTYVASCDNTFVIVTTGAGGPDWAEGGDSGGPVWDVNTAVGIVSGYWAGTDPRGVFMPQEFMSALSLQVAIQ